MSEQETGLPEPQTLPDMTGAADTAQQRVEEENEYNPWLTSDAPLYPLGLAGREMLFIDSKAQHIACDGKLSNVQLVMHCGTIKWLEDKFPKWRAGKNGKPPELIGFDHAEAMQSLAMACNKRGLFDAKDRVFGRGAHRAKDNSQTLVLHAGTSLFLANSRDERGRKRKGVYRVNAGPYGDAFYPAQSALPAPAQSAATRQELDELHASFGDWEWLEPEAAQLLLMGMVGQLFICGALEWRSHVWLTGGTGCGKSTLQKYLRMIGGKWIVSSEDASEAWVRQKLETDRLPVMLDEAEVDDGAERQQAMLNLARKGSSGGSLGRGTSDQKAKDFEIFSCFIMSSIIHGIHMGQDRNRFAILGMKPLDFSKPAPVFDEAYLRGLGARIQRRMMELWPNFDPLYAAWQKEIRAAGFSARWAATIGTLLTCADLLMYEQGWIDDDGRPVSAVHFGWIEIVRPLMERGAEEAQTDSERCIAFLRSTHLPGASGQSSEPVGRWIHRVIMGSVDEGGHYTENKAAADRLSSYGLRVATVRPKDSGGYGYAKPLPEDFTDNYLLIAGPQMRALSDLFRASGEWAKGGWIQSLQKLEGAVSVGKVRFDGMSCSAIAVPMRHVLEGPE